jgi:glutamate/tyrosine decarboxylase-like PLP-dependent enzyme
MELPKTGTPREKLFETMRERKARDADWRGARTWSLVYHAGEDVDDVLREANSLYLFENALNPLRFPSLRQMEVDVVEMTAGLLHAGPAAGGAMTSGGTESILMAVLAARERAKAERGVTRPELVIPISAHPAFAKAAKYLGLVVREIPLRADLRADPVAAAGLVGDETALVVGSAPSYPHGVVDPIPELAALALARGISFHTDACVGGFLLPFLERLGHPVPPFDFRVPGVTTMSADVHKYGWCNKGASVVVHRDEAHLKKYQLFVYDRWPGGLYASFSMAGTRPAPPIAAAWAVMQYLGEEGYVRLARVTLDTTKRLRDGIEAIPELHFWGDPDATLLAFGSESVDVMAVGDAMDDRGWHLDRQKRPDALHLMVTPNHARIVDRFLSDLRDSVATATKAKSRGVEARYS